MRLHPPPCPACSGSAKQPHELTSSNAATLLRRPTAFNFSASILSTWQMVQGKGPQCRCANGATGRACTPDRTCWSMDEMYFSTTPFSCWMLVTKMLQLSCVHAPAQHMSSVIEPQAHSHIYLVLLLAMGIVAQPMLPTNLQ